MSNIFPICKHLYGFLEAFTYNDCPPRHDRSSETMSSTSSQQTMDCKCPARNSLPDAVWYSNCSMYLPARAVSGACILQLVTAGGRRNGRRVEPWLSTQTNTISPPIPKKFGTPLRASNHEITAGCIKARRCMPKRTFSYQ